MDFKKKLGLGALVTAVSVVASSPAMAALPTEATDAFTTIGTDAGSLISSAWPVVLLVTGGLITIRLFRRIIGAAT